ncbi:MAG: hypothetical protein CO094_00915 [Anaerolineae bacterium CG_4_9_14_3_um_filter_57_17]|nr:MAG: hypothetical protein COW42_07455 [Deltaproteobacteria bacterium CG17_big_fil_post_rev_8_21_14_2_50_63_7]PJB68538.1 MAG: hypothetical protein CO094_00915 [Anaerolineae bacterium CG_4_9_14_3_um_filter_57_17]
MVAEAGKPQSDTVTSRQIIPTWSTLKALSSSGLARLTIIVPVVGWLLIYNDTLARLLSSLLRENVQIEYSWKLYIFYIGLTFISISAVIFIVRCPRTIAHHLNRLQYIEKERAIFTRATEARESKELGLVPLQWQSPNGNYAREDGSYPLVRIYEANEEIILDRMQEIFRKQDSKYPISRFFSILAFMIGAILTLLPTLSTLTWSACSTVENTSDWPWPDKLQNTCSLYLHGSEDVLKNVQ